MGSESLENAYVSKRFSATLTPLKLGRTVAAAAWSATAAGACSDERARGMSHDLHRTAHRAGGDGAVERRLFRARFHRHRCLEAELTVRSDRAGVDLRGSGRALNRAAELLAGWLHRERYRLLGAIERHRHRPRARGDAATIA